MQEDVGHAVIRHDEAVTLGNIEPFDDAGHLNDMSRRLIAEIDVGSEPRSGSFWFDPVGRHDAVAAASVLAPRAGAFTNLLNRR